MSEPEPLQKKTRPASAAKYKENVSSMRRKKKKAPGFRNRKKTRPCRALPRKSGYGVRCPHIFVQNRAMAWSVFTFSLRIALPCPRIFAQNRVLVWSVLAFGIVLSHRESSYFREIFAQNRAAAWSVVIYSLSQALSQGARSYWFMEPDFSLTRGRGGRFRRVGEDDFRRRFLHPFARGAKTNFGGEDDFRRQNSCRRQYSKTIFGHVWPGGEDEWAGEDDFRRRFSEPFGRGAKTN